MTKGYFGDKKKEKQSRRAETKHLLIWRTKENRRVKSNQILTVVILEIQGKPNATQK